MKPAGMALTPLKIRLKLLMGLTVVLVVLQLCCSLWARPTTADEAEEVVKGRLKADAQLLGNAPGRDVSRVETFRDNDGRPVYYVVYLQPSGYVVVSADNLVEPIIAFAGGGVFEPMPQNPLWVLVNNDLRGRIRAVRDTFNLQMDTAERPGGKWRYLIDLAEAPDGGIALMGRGTVTDVRVEPLVQSKWGQLYDACGEYCYNYYTPRHYYCGCTATAMAQFMRYHEYPDTSVEIGRSQFEIKVNDISEYANTLGGDGNGGPYNWDLMEFEPDCNTTSEKQQAIGTLCYDAGVAARTEYSYTGSSSSLRDAKKALLNTFGYSNAIRAFLSDSDIEGDWLNDMVNANLDAGYPVILGVKNTEAENGHAVLADGYGYDFSTLYHHLNMGWEGSDDIWYNLPDVNYIPSGYYNVLEGCIYNIFIAGSGEIISGRVTDISGHPISEATVTAQGGDRLYTAVTNSRGVYALVNVSSYSTYTMRVTKAGFTFATQSVAVEKSGNSRNSSGNEWGIDFVGDYVSASGPVISDCSTEDFETGDFSKFPWEHSGDNNWIITSMERYSGACCAEAGQIENGESVTLRVSVDCVSGDIRFRRKVSSELGFDFLKFYIDGVEVYRLSGIKEWDEVSFPVTAGARIFKWTYSKDGSISRGADTVWIDDIVFPTDCNQISLDAPVLHAEPEMTAGPDNMILWEPVPGAGEYRAECAGDAEFGNIIADSGWIDQTSYMFTELGLGQEYWYRVKCRAVEKWSQINQAELQADTLTDTVVSTQIDLPADGDWNWDMVRFNSTIPSGTGLMIDVLDALDESVLLADVVSGTDISDIGVRSIKLRVNLPSSSLVVTPILHDWSVTYIRASCESDWSEAESSFQCETPCDE